jgi:hypothetical protein
VTVCVESSDEKLGSGLDESYSFTLAGGSTPSTLHAATVYGALRGLQTLSEMTSPFQAGTVFNTPVEVNDKPAYGCVRSPRDPAAVFMDCRFSYTRACNVHSLCVFSCVAYLSIHVSCTAHDSLTRSPTD